MSTQLLPWPDNPFHDPPAPMVNSPIVADVAIGHLVYTYTAGTSAFTLGARTRDGSIFWGHH